jgi:hypothetical protein
VSCAFITARPLTGGGEAFRLTFEVLRTAPGGGTALALSEATLNRGVPVLRRDGLVHTTPAYPRIQAAYPNPFNTQTTVRLFLPQAAVVDLEVVDAVGQQVRRLVEGRLEAGVHVVAWDGRTEDGHSAATGMYMCRLRTPARAAAAKLLLVR